MGSALLNTTTEAEFALAAPDCASASRPSDAQSSQRTQPGSADALRIQVAERLAEHRRRRAGAGNSSPITSAATPARSGSMRSARIAAAVADRYAKTPSYRAILAAEAERAIEQARAAAEVAAMNAQAIADAQQRMLDAFDEDQDALRRATFNAALAAEVQRATSASVHKQDEFDDAPSSNLPPGRGDELNLWPELGREVISKARPETVRRTMILDPRSADSRHEVAKSVALPTAQAAGLTVRLYDDVSNAAHEYRGVTHRVLASASSPAHTNRREYRNDDEANALDEEIAFRQAPVFEEPAGPPVPLPANLIEFPRQLVASRKARPRVAEGPLRDEAETAPGDSQLRIFEVDSAQISTHPDQAETDTTQWNSIWLDTPAKAAAMEDYAAVEHGLDSLHQSDNVIPDPGRHSIAAPQAASIGRRVFSGGIDLGVVIVGMLAFAAASATVFMRVVAWQTVTDQMVAWHAGTSTLETMRSLADSLAGLTGMQSSQLGVIAATSAVFFILLYHALFFWFSETTPGMRCARIGLCTFDDDNPTRRAIRRRLGAMLLSACALGLGFLWATLDEESLTWHDRMTRMYLREY